MKKINSTVPSCSWMHAFSWPSSRKWIYWYDNSE